MDMWCCCPVYKRDDRERACKYRGITLTDTGFKIYTNVLKSKLDEQIKCNKFYSDTKLIIGRVMEIYSETASLVKINNKESNTYWKEKGRKVDLRLKDKKYGRIHMLTISYH